IRRPVFDPVPVIVAIDRLWLLHSDFNLLYQEGRIRPTVRKKIEGNIARVGRPNRIRLRVRICRQRSRGITRQVDQPQTPGSMLMERVQCQVLSIRRKRELLKIDYRIEAADHTAISSIPVELIEG